MQSFTEVESNFDKRLLAIASLNLCRKSLYALLEAIKIIPETAGYRKTVEATVKHRLISKSSLFAKIILCYLHLHFKHQEGSKEVSMWGIMI